MSNNQRAIDEVTGVCNVLRSFLSDFPDHESDPSRMIIDVFVQETREIMQTIAKIIAERRKLERGITRVEPRNIFSHWRRWHSRSTQAVKETLPEEKEQLEKWKLVFDKMQQVNGALTLQRESNLLYQPRKNQIRVFLNELINISVATGSLN